MDSKNEAIFCEILPELCRRYEQTRFADTLNIFIRDLRFGVDEKFPEDVEFQIEGVRCFAVFENCKAVRQKRMSETDEMMFGIFGQDSPQIKKSEIPAEVLALNARLILPRASDQYVSHIEIRNYEIELPPSFCEIFSCSPSEIKLSQNVKTEIYLHVNLKKEQQTTRSALFEAILLMLEELKMEKEVKRISKLCIPFVHFGKVRISVKLEEKTGNIRVEIFNLFGSLFGFMNISDSENNTEEELFLTETMLKTKFTYEDLESEDSMEEIETVNLELEESAKPTLSESTPLLISILQNQMNLLKPQPSDFLSTPLPYLGIDSLRLAELEYHITNSSEFKVCKLKAPFLISYKTLAQVAQFLDGKREEAKLERKLEMISNDIPSMTWQLSTEPDNFQFKVPLSSQQKRMLFIREFEKEQLKSSNIGSQFDEPILLRFSHFPHKKITRILNQLIILHSIFRTRYSEDFQYLLSGTECFVPVTVKDTENRARDLILPIQCILKPDGIIRIVFNHISIDGRSMLIFYRQFKEMLNSRDFKSPAGTLQYHDYCSLSMPENSKESVAYWKEYLNSDLEKIPYDFSEASELFTASYLHVSFPKSLQKKFDSLCFENSLSRFELYLGILEISLQRVFGLSDSLALGFAVDQRTFQFFETIGCFTNVLGYLSSHNKSSDLLSRLKTCQKTMRESRNHDAIPYESLVKLSGVEGDLFQVFVVSDVVEVDPVSSEKSKRRVRFEDEAVHVEVIQDLESTERKVAKYPMTWYLRQFGNDELHVEVEFAQEIFRQETVESILEEMFRIINSQIGSEENRRSKLEKSQWKSDFPTITVSQIILLNTEGARIRHLKNNSSIQPRALSSQFVKSHIQFYCQLLSECPVVLNIPRSPDLIQAVLGCWNAGFYPVPLHRDATEEQIQNLCRGLGMKKAMILKNLNEFKSESHGRVFNQTTLFDLAYVTSTSGSTGTPKLVGTSFEGHSNLARQYTTSFQISSQDTIGQVVDPSFDIFFADIVKTFTNGARLLLARDAIATTSELRECTNVYLMPAFLSRIPDMECFENLETLQYGGEPLAPQVLEQIFRRNRNLKVWQEFGLTEQTVYSARRRIIPSRLPDPDEMRKIGECYDNIHMTVRSFDGKEEGVQRGQLILKGVGLMRGYFGVTTKSLEQFPTGDEVRKLENGGMVFIARKDSQVKIRGHRVDLFEIECMALSTKLLESCTCILVDSKRLVLFFKMKASEDIHEGIFKLQSYLERELISYKIPDNLIHLEQFPLTRTGKVDKKQLEHMTKNGEEVISSKEIETISTRVVERKEENLTSSLLKWLQFYSKSPIDSPDVDIFSSGVDSISVMLTMQKLRSEGIEIPVKIFFKLKTIRKIVDWFYSSSDSLQKSESIEKLVVPDKVIEKRPDHFINLNHIQQRILFLSRMMTSSDPFGLQFSIDIPTMSSVILCQVLNFLFMGNQMLRAKLQRIQGEYRFALLSGTECFRVMEEKNQDSMDQFMTRVWLDQSKSKLILSIHHIICDGRSLKILEDQLKKAFGNGGDSVKFENNFVSHSVLVGFHDLYAGLEQWKSLYSTFQMGSNSSKIEFPLEIQNNFENVPSTFKVAFAYGQAIAKVFNFQSDFPIATTLSNRTEKNWNTVSMFANTLPLAFDPKENLEQFVEKFYKLNENSNIPLTEVLPNGFTGVLADFALNFHKSLGGGHRENLCQFPMLLTYSESENMAELEFDANFISEEKAELLKMEVLNQLGCSSKPKTVNFVDVFQKFLNSKVSGDTDFFHAGGHSLTAMKLIDELIDFLEIEIPLKLIFECRTPRKLEEAVNALKMGLMPQITEKNNFTRTDSREDSHRSQFHSVQPKNFEFPLSRQQQQMFYLSQLTKNSLEYQLPFIQPFPSTIQPSEIHRSLLMTIQEQNIFRTVFKTNSETGEPYQEVVSMTEAFIRCYVEYVDNEKELHKRIRELCEEPIDVLSGFPLLKATFVSSPERHAAFLHLHHLISDARSTQLTNSTMKSFFEDSKRNPTRSTFTYLDYCSLEQEEITVFGKEYIDILESGLNGLKTKAPDQRKPVKCFIEISKGTITEKLTNGKPGTTPFSIFLEIVASSLYSKFANFNLAFPVLNRNERTSNICGYFLNNLLINTSNLSNLPSILNSNLPYSDVIREVRKVSGKDVPVAEVYMNCRYDLEYDESDDEILLDLVPLKLHFPIEIDVDLLANEKYRITMRSDRFDRDEILQILSRVKNSLEVSDERIPNQQEIEFGRTLYGLKKDSASYSTPQLYQKFFNSNVTSIFATSSSKKISYGQVYRQLLNFAWKLSRNFLWERGASIRSDDIIAVIGTKSIETTVRCLAVQFAGASYLPIDQGYPKERQKEILKDAVFVFRESNSSDEFTKVHRHFSISTSHCLSYVITTSGTTGHPKSVAIEADSLSNLSLSSTLTMRVSSSSRIFQFTNFVFDNSVLEICMAIASQATLVYGSSTFDPVEFEKSVDTSGITHCLLFPSLVQSFDIGRIRRLPYWIVGGERLPQTLLDSALNLGIQVIQNYGPTETTAFAIAKQMRKGDQGCQIGHPAVNSKVKICKSEDGQGELLISGRGIMRGYLNREPSESFKTIDEKQWYASGDVCKILRYSEVEFVGRTDSQIKVRGFRVELSEIEAVMESHLDVNTCKALFEHETQQIHAFYTGNVSSDDVRKHCERHLEPQKIPSTFNSVREFPLTKNSKIDKAKLMEHVKNPQKLSQSLEPCSLESDLSEIWISLLNCPKPLSSDHFFLVGGHSLLLIRLRHLIQTKLEVNLSVPEILENLQFGDMLSMLRKKKETVEYQEANRKSKTIVFFPALYGGCTAYLKMVTLLKSSFLNSNILLLDEESGENVEEVVSRYKTQILAKTKNPSSSFVFIGASSAGVFAFATSQKFQDEVTVVLLDSGTFWNLIEKLDYSKHEAEMIENLKNYEVDTVTARSMAKDSWKTLQILKNYKPIVSSDTHKVHILSVDGSDLGWSKFSRNPMTHKINGDHYSMLQDFKNVAEVVKIVENIISSS